MNNKLIVNIIVLVLFLTLANEEAYSNNRKIIFDRIMINGKSLPESEFSKVIVSSSDSIEINFSLDAGKTEKTPFVFQVKFSNYEDTLVTAYNNTIIKYENLTEGKYFVTLVAFDRLKKWETESLRLEIECNSSMAEVYNKYLAAKEDLLIQNKAFKAKEKDLMNLEEKSSGPNFISVVYGIVGTLLISGIVLFISKATKPKKKPAKTQSNDFDFTEDEIKLIMDEHSNFKQELGMLRGQIDVLQMRSEELKDTNLELEESVQRLSSIKEELENLQTQKDELFAIIIHDIKNPAALIKSLVELLRSYDLTASEQQDIMNDILTTTSKIVSLSHEVSRVLALEGGKMRLDLESNDPTEIARDVYNRNVLKAKNKSIDLSIDFDSDIPMAHFDSQKLDEVLDNLVSNAIKFTNEDGFVKIKLYSDTDRIVFEINDTGQGLSEEDLKNAFQRGAQLSAKPTKGESSTGLGLWIVKKLVEAHSGRVWVRSSQGKGSTFAFSIPINSHPEAVAEVDLSGY